MKLLIFHQFYTRSDEPGIQRFGVFAPYWENEGIEMTVIAGNVNYMTGKRYERRYKKIGGDVKYDWDSPIKLKRVFTSSFGFGYRSYIGRIFTYLTFVFSSFFTGMTEKPRVVVASSPPIFLALVGWAVARLKKARFIFEVRDLWPDEIIELGGLKNKVLIKMSYAIEKFLYEHADKIVVNSPGLKDFLTTNKKIEAGKIENIPNPVSFNYVVDEKNKNISKNLGWEGKTIVLYSGSHSMVYDFDSIINAAKELQDNNPPLFFVFIGDGRQKPKMKERVLKEGVKNVQFLDSMPKFELVMYVAAADICIVSLGKMGLLRHVYATKVLDYMSMKKPVVVAMEGVTRDLVNEAQCGICVALGDVEGLKRAILALARYKEKRDELGENGYKYVKENFDGELLAKRYAEVFEIK